MLYVPEPDSRFLLTGWQHRYKPQKYHKTVHHLFLHKNCYERQCIFNKSYMPESTEKQCICKSAARMTALAACLLHVVIHIGVRREKTGGVTFCQQRY